MRNPRLIAAQQEKIMQRLRKIHLMVGLVALVAALSVLMASPVSAQTACAGPTAGDIDDDVTVALFCSVSPGDTINGNVTLAAGAEFEVNVLGTVKGNVTLAAGADLSVSGTVDGDIDAPAGGFIGVSGGTVNGNIEGGPGTVELVGGTVNGNIEVTGTPAAGSQIILVGGASAPGVVSVVNGNVIHNGTGTEFFGPNSGVVLLGFGVGTRVEGNIEATNGAGVENDSSFFGLVPHTVTGDIKCNGVAGDDLALGAPNMTVGGNLENCG